MSLFTSTMSSQGTRKLIVKLKNESTGSPRLHKRVVNVNFAVDPFDRNIYLDEIGEIRSLIGKIVNVDAPMIIETRLEHMVEIAIHNILRPHSEREISIEWKKDIENHSITEVGFVIDFFGYDPPIKVFLSTNGNTMNIKVEFHGKHETVYSRAKTLDVLRPIDVLVLRLIHEFLELVERIIKVWLNVEERGMIIWLPGGWYPGNKYVVFVKRDQSLLEQATTQEVQNTSQVQEQAITQEAQSAQDTQVHQTDAETP